MSSGNPCVHYHGFGHNTWVRTITISIHCRERLGKGEKYRKKLTSSEPQNHMDTRFVCIRNTFQENWLKFQSLNHLTVPTKWEWLFMYRVFSKAQIGQLMKVVAITTKWDNSWLQFSKAGPYHWYPLTTFNRFSIF